MTATERPEPRWLLFAHQIPAKPAYLRVKVWRRLLSLGAVALKNSVYALPASEGVLEDFEWLLKEIVAGGGEAVIVEARLVGGLTDADAKEIFREAREADYGELAKSLRVALEALASNLAGSGRDPDIQLSKFKARRDEIVAIDFFGANGREAVEGLLLSLETRIRQSSASDLPPPQEAQVTKPIAKAGTWVTRERLFVDRIASGWLIRRFIDPEARFKFVPAKGYAPAAGEIRFDMFEAEYTHEGDNCTFEVLLGLVDRDDALAAIGEIVHDIDLKDGKFGRLEAPGIEMVMAGICAPGTADEERLVRGSEVFEGLYQNFRRSRG